MIKEVTIQDIINIYKTQNSCVVICSAGKFGIDIANKLNFSIVDTVIKSFEDGEKFVCINDSVENKNVFLMQSMSKPVNENLMELLIFADACKRAGAKKIIAVIPYLCYMRQEKREISGEPITSKLIAKLIETSGIQQIITVDIHCKQIEGFFEIPIYNILSMDIIFNYVKNNINGYTIVAPDLGGLKKIKEYIKHKKYNCDIVTIVKTRPTQNHTQVECLLGNVNNKNCVLIDDIVDTGRTLVNDAIALKQNGATSIIACCSHGLLNNDACNIIYNSPIDKLVILDTVCIDDDKKNILKDKLLILPTTDVIYDTIKNIIL